LLCLEAAAIDADVQIQINNLLDLLDTSSEGMDHSRCESIPILADQVVEIISGIPVMEIHGQFPLLSQVEVEGEDC
jgi:hypothetical protein